MPKPFLPQQLSGTLTIANMLVKRVIKLLKRIKFDDCYEATADGSNLPRRPGIYAFKHRDKRILYVGKSNNVRQRFNARHGVFVDLFFAGYAIDDLRIAVVPIIGDDLPYLEIIEAIVISTLTPEFNRKRYTLAEIAAMVAVRSFKIPADIQLTDLLPPNAVAAIEDYAKENLLSSNQVIELALAQFLDYETVTLDGYDHLKSFAQLKNQIEIMQAELDGLKRQMSDE